MSSTIEPAMKRAGAVVAGGATAPTRRCGKRATVSTQENAAAAARMNSTMPVSDREIDKDRGRRAQAQFPIAAPPRAPTRRAPRRRRPRSAWRRPKRMPANSISGMTRTAGARPGRAEPSARAETHGARGEKSRGAHADQHHQAHRDDRGRHEAGDEERRDRERGDRAQHQHGDGWAGRVSPIAAEAASTAAASAGRNPRARSMSRITEPTAATSADFEPEKPETRYMLTTMTCNSPPRKCPTRACDERTRRKLEAAAAP